MVFPLFKRSQRDVSDSSKHWYQDKYQHVLVQRNMLALLALVALVVALVAVFSVARLAPLKSVEPYLVQVDEKTGITRTVDTLSRNRIAADEKIDRYFVSLYVRTRESYNISVLRYNYNVIRVLSAIGVYNDFNEFVRPSNENSPAAKLGTLGQREVVINSMSYIVNPPMPNGQIEVTPEKIMQVNFTTTDILPNAGDSSMKWVATVTFIYAKLSLNETDRMLNPLDFVVTNYQVQRELN